MFERLKLSKRISEHDEALQRVERRLTSLEIQWGDTLDRLKTMMGRLLKERARTEKAAENFASESPENDAQEVSEPGGHGWTPAQLAAQQRILARRNRAGREQ
jgi:hypothetical protein